MASVPLAWGIFRSRGLFPWGCPRYLKALVTRYSNNPTIAAWEMGNEWNLVCVCGQPPPPAFTVSPDDAGRCHHVCLCPCCMPCSLLTWTKQTPPMGVHPPWEPPRLAPAPTTFPRKSSWSWRQGEVLAACLECEALSPSPPPLRIHLIRLIGFSTDSKLWCTRRIACIGPPAPVTR